MKNFIHISIFLILSSFSLFPQTQDPNVKEDLEEITAYRISEIPTKLEDEQSYLSRLETEIILDKEIETSLEKLDELNDSYNLLRVQTDSIDLELENSATLNEYQLKWEAHVLKISEWADIIKNRTIQLEDQKLKLAKKIEVWELTKKLAAEDKAPKDLVKSIDDIIGSLSTIENKLVEVLNESVRMQTKLSDQSIDADATLNKINQLLKTKERKIFTQNAPLIWENITEFKDSTELSIQFSKIWDSYLRTGKDFLRNNRERLIQDLFILLFFILFVYSLKFFSRNIKEKDDKVALSIKLLERPISAAILIFLLIAHNFYDNAPEIFFNILRILVVLPLLRILLHILKPHLKIPLFYFCLLIILQQFMLSAGSGTEIERILLLIITFLSLTGLIWIVLKKYSIKINDTKSSQSGTHFISKLALVLVVIALITNIFGYVMLSIVLINGVINSTYGIILLITAALALNALIILSLQTKPAQKFRVVKYQSTEIKLTTAKIIRLIVIVWSIIVVLRNFGVYNAVYLWLDETLNKVWEIGDLSISILNIILFFISIWLAVITARFARFILEGDVLPRLKLARGVPGAIASITSYIIIGLGILVAMVTAGIDLNSFALVAGALGVGIGFGLQDLVKNFISGLILIFERPIQIGDAVQVDDLAGRVLKIGIRSSVIKTWDGAEVIVPNGNLIQNKLVNWTLSDQLRRIDISVGVSYGTNVKLVMQTLLGCAANHSKVLTSPAPVVLFNDFADSCLEFELRCWTSDYPNWIFIRSDIRIAIDEAFEKEGIVIPFPQRDLHIINDKTNEGADEDEVERRNKRFQKSEDKEAKN